MTAVSISFMVEQPKKWIYILEVGIKIGLFLLFISIDIVANPEAKL